MIYVDQPVLALVPLVLVALQVAIGVIKKRVSARVYAVLTGVCVTAHAVAVSAVLLLGGALSDVLLLVLLSSVVALALSQKEGTP